MIRSNPQPFDMRLARQMTEEGRRLMDHFQGFDQSSVDKNAAAGEVQVDIPSRFGINHACARFSGDRYDGTLETNNDERQVYLDRRFEFKNEEGLVIITQQVPSYGPPRFDVYRIDEIHQLATLERIEAQA